MRLLAKFRLNMLRVRKFRLNMLPVRKFRLNMLPVRNQLYSIKWVSMARVQCNNQCSLSPNQQHMDTPPPATQAVSRLLIPAIP